MNVKVSTAPAITFACCALHNFLIDNDDTYISSVQYPTAATNSDTSTSTYNPRRGEAEGSRREFMTYFNKEGKLDWKNVSNSTSNVIHIFVTTYSIIFAMNLQECNVNSSPDDEASATNHTAKEEEVSARDAVYITNFSDLLINSKKKRRV